jgi:hypothetical protein
VGYVVSRFGKLTEGELECRTHGEPPWQRANRDRPPGASVRIDPEWIREYFATDGAVDAGIGTNPAAAAWIGDAAARRARPSRTNSPEEILVRLARLGGSQPRSSSA